MNLQFPVIDSDWPAAREARENFVAAREIAGRGRRCARQGLQML
jgi:hypothetical protein